jgi:hypothetical protein
MTVSIHPERILIWRKLIWDPLINSLQEKKKKEIEHQRCPNYQFVRFVPYPAWSYPHVYNLHLPPPALPTYHHVHGPSQPE